MQKTIGMLGALLVAQLVLAVGLSFSGPDLTAHRPDTPFLDLDGHSVDRLTIEGLDEQRIVLARQDDGWVLPGTGDFPADKASVDRLLEQLKGLKRGLAIATTEGAQQRFKVSDDDFERRVMLGEGDQKLATLYFGTSPAMRRVHARTGEDTAVYTAEFGIYDASLKPEDWEDKGVLKLPQGEIESIHVAELDLVRAPAETADAPAGEKAKQKPATVWNAEGLHEHETLNQTNADALAQKLATLTIGSVLGQEAKPEYALDAPALTVEVQRQGGEAIEYRLGKRAKENDYVLKVSGRPEYFRLPGYTAEALVKAAGRDQLVSAVTAAAGDGEAAQKPDESAPAGGANAPGRATTGEDAS